MKLGEIIRQLECSDNVSIDILDGDGWDEGVFEGSILDIPWYMLDYTLQSHDNGEAISVYIDKKGQSSFCICLKAVNVYEV